MKDTVVVGVHGNDSADFGGEVIGSRGTSRGTSMVPCFP